jgi:hypothetical protein
MVSKLFLVEMAFGGNGNRTFFVFGGKGLWWKRETPLLLVPRMSIKLY